MDIEAEMGRYEMNLETEMKQYNLMELPVAPPQRQMTVALDCLSTCCLGVHVTSAQAAHTLS